MGHRNDAQEFLLAHPGPTGQVGEAGEEQMWLCGAEETHILTICSLDAGLNHRIPKGGCAASHTTRYPQHAVQAGRQGTALLRKPSDSSWSFCLHGTGHQEHTFFKGLCQTTLKRLLCISQPRVIPRRSSIFSEERVPALSLFPPPSLSSPESS